MCGQNLLPGYRRRWEERTGWKPGLQADPGSLQSDVKFRVCPVSRYLNRVDTDILL